MKQGSNARNSRRCVRARDARRGGKSGALDALPVLQWPADVLAPQIIAGMPVTHCVGSLASSEVTEAAKPRWGAEHGYLPTASAESESLKASNAEPVSVIATNPASVDAHASNGPLHPDWTSQNSAETAQPAECENIGRKRSRTGDEIWAFNMLLGKIAEQLADPEDSRPSKRSCRRMTLQEMFRKRKSERWDDIEEVAVEEEKPPPVYEPPPFLEQAMDTDDDEDDKVLLPVTSTCRLPNPIRYVSRDEDTLDHARAESQGLPNKSDDELPISNTAQAQPVHGSICAVLSGVRSATQPVSKAVSCRQLNGTHKAGADASVVRDASSDAIRRTHCATGSVAEATRVEAKGMAVRHPHPSSSAPPMMKAQHLQHQHTADNYCNDKGIPAVQRQKAANPAGTDGAKGVEAQGATPRRSLRLAAVASLTPPKHQHEKSDASGGSSGAPAIQSSLPSPALPSMSKTPRTACRTSRLGGTTGQIARLRDSFNSTSVEDGSTAGARSSLCTSSGAVGHDNKKSGRLPSDSQDPAAACGTPQAVRGVGPDLSDLDDLEWRWRTRRGAMMASGLTPGGPKSTIKGGLGTPSRYV